MMALKLQDLRDKHGHVNRSASTSLQKRLVNSWPAVSGGKKGKAAAASNKAGIQSASSVQVGDMSVNVADGEDARLQLRHEVDRVLASRGTGSGMQYLVKWKHCAAQDATWEASSSDAMRSDAARAALAELVVGGVDREVGQLRVGEGGAEDGLEGLRQQLRA